MLKDWLLLCRIKPHWLVMVACALMLSPSPQLSYVALLLLFAYSNAIYGELVNFAYDYSIDIQNPKLKNYPHVTGKIKISSVKRLSSIFLLLVLGSGLALFMTKNELLLLILLALNATYSYSVPPLRIKRYWWGGFVTYTPYAAIVLLISAALLGSAQPTATMTAVAFWIGSLSLWMLGGIPDKRYDKKNGVETPATKFGDEKCINAYLWLSLLSSAISAAIIINSANSFYAGIPFLIPLTIAITAYIRMKKELVTGISIQNLQIAILPHRYIMVFVTLAYFILLNT